MRIEKEGEYGKAIVTFPDAVEHGGTYEVILEWYPNSRLPIFTVAYLHIRKAPSTRITWHATQGGFCKRAPSPLSRTLIITDDTIGASGDTFYATLNEARGILGFFGKHVLYTLEMQIL